MADRTIFVLENDQLIHNRPGEAGDPPAGEWTAPNSDRYFVVGFDEGIENHMTVFRVVVRKA